MKRKMLIAVSLIFIMLLNCILPIAQVRATTDVEITLNGALYKAIKSNLQRQGIAFEYNDAQRLLRLKEENLARVTALNLSNFAIKDLTGLETFSNLTSLDLSANKLNEESNLEVISNLSSLEFLDISSNEIADVSMISNVDTIKKVNLHNQKFHRVEIIEVDDSDESNQVTSTTFPLPQILSKATENGMLNPDWLPEEKEEGGPYVNWRVFNGVEVEIVTAEKTGDSFKGLYGMTVLRIRVTDPENPLYNSDISLFYISVSSEERGIIFKDKNLYNAVKKQLTKGQDLNEDLVETEIRNLFKKAYDEPMVLVITIDDLINNIPSLQVADKKVVDLTGIERFVGLEKELNASNNYIEDILKITELRDLKEMEANKLRQRFQKQQTLVKEIKTKMDAEKKIIKDNEEKMKKLDEEISALVEKYATAADNEKANIDKQIEAKNKEKETAALAKREAEIKLAGYMPTFEVRMKKMYSIFEKQYTVTSILTAPLARQTEDEFLNMTKEEAKTLLDAQLDRVGNLEEDLTGYEKQYLINYFGIPTTVEVEVDKKQPDGTVIKETVIKDIEGPIKTYFATLKEGTKDMAIGSLKASITEMKTIAEVFKMANYCFSERLYNNSTACLAEEYLDKQIELKEIDGVEHSILTRIKDNLSEHLDDLKAAGNTCVGAVTFTNNFEDIYAIAGRIAKITAEEINDNVVIPQLKYLDVSVNLIESIAGIEGLPELKGLYVGDNELCDISNVDWSQMVNLLELDVSFNDISNIKPLEVIASLQKLSVAKNLLEGAFDFNFSGMPKLHYFDLSQNRIDDIQYLRNQLIYVARGAGYDDISGYLKSGAFDIKLYGQRLSMNIELTNESNLTYVNLPNIFRQAEELDYDRTSFAVNSILGNATNDGKQVILETSRLGTFQAEVSITTGTYGTNSSSGYVSPYGIAYGTTCTIYYTVIENPEIPPVDDNTVNNDVVTNEVNNTVDNTVENTVENKVENTVNNTVDNTINNTVDNTVDNTVTDPEEDDIKLGYKTDEEYILGVSPNTSINDFKTKLTTEYKVEVKSNGKLVENGNVGTAMITVLYDKDNKAIAIYEVVVKGDLNGDGTADAVDSSLIKAHRADVTRLSGAYEKAADINSDGSIDAIDARMLLYHRAEVPGYLL